MNKIICLAVILILASCTTPVQVYVPKSYCGYVFILIDKNAKNDVVTLDENGVGFLSEEFARSSEKLEYHITHNGKDITDECSEFKVHTISSSNSNKEHMFLSFRVKCKNIKSNQLTEDERFEQIENNLKVSRWLEE